MERDTAVFVEWQFAVKELHMPYDEYLKNTSEPMKIFNMVAYNLDNAKQAYWNTPPDKRFSFLA